MEVSGRKLDDVLCEPCREDGQKLLAVGFCVDCCEYLCGTCYKHHCIPRPFKNHVLQDKETMPRTKPDSTSIAVADTGDKCSIHGGEIIKFFCCSDHTLGCGSCMTVNHRKCNEIVSIVEEYDKFENEMKDFGLQIENNSQTEDQNSTDIENTHTQAVKDIKLFMSEIKHFFENLENGMITDADSLKDKNEKKMKNISVTCMTLRNDLHSLTSDLSKLHQTQQYGKLFTMMEEARDQMKTIAKEIDEMNKDNKVEKYTFVPEKQIQDLIGNMSDLGKLNTEHKPNPNYQTEMLKTSEEYGPYQLKTLTNAKLLQTANQDKNGISTSNSKAYPESIASNIRTQATSPAKSTKTEQSDVKSAKINSWSSLVTPRQKDNLALYSATASSSSVTATGIPQYQFRQRQVTVVKDIKVSSFFGDKETWITGIALLPDDQLVLVDVKNIKVKLVNTKQNKLVTEMKLSSRPWDITAVNNTLVAMTMPYANQIQLLSVSNKKLSEGQTLEVKGECRGIVHNDGTFIVTYLTPGKVEIMSMSGKVLKVISKRSYGELFVCPCYIAISPDNTHVYISDYNTQLVTCMTLDGVVKGVYRDKSLCHPDGLTVDKSGSVYVVKDSIYQISGDCSQGQELQGCELKEHPHSITYCHKEDKLYVGGDISSIRVYKLK